MRLRRLSRLSVRRRQTWGRWRVVAWHSGTASLWLRGEKRREFLKVQLAIVVCIDRFKLTLQAIRALGLAKRAILVGVPFIEHMGGALGWSLLTNADFVCLEVAVGVCIQGFQGTGGAGDFSGGQGPVMVDIQRIQDGVESGHSFRPVAANGSTLRARLGGGERGDLVLGELAIVVRVSAQEERLHALGEFIGCKDAVAVTVQSHKAPLQIGLTRTTGLLRKVLVRGELPIVVAIEREKALWRLLDLVGGELAVVVQVEGFQHRSAGWLTVGAGLSGKRGGEA